MATTVTLMVHPAANEPNNPPQFLAEERTGQSNGGNGEGLWRNLGFSESMTKVTLKEVQDAIDGAIDNMRQSIDADVPVQDAMNPLKTKMNKKFYELLIPPSVDEILARAAAQGLADGEAPILRIHVTPEYDWIPWEIMHDKTDFLGVRFRIARLPIVPTIPDLSNNNPHRVENIVSVLGYLGHGVLDDALSQTWTTTFSELAGAEQVHVTPIPVDPLAGPWPRSIVLESTTESDIVHFTCHGGIEDEEGAYWVLDYDNPNLEANRIGVEAVSISDLSSRHPLVFGNACRSTAGGAAGSPLPGLTGGFGPTFFASGATAFVGTCALIDPQMAFDFPRQFYRHLLGDERLPIAEALRRTKLSYQGQADADPSWLFYCLYGPPEASFALGLP